MFATLQARIAACACVAVLFVGLGGVALVNHAKYRAEKAAVAAAQTALALERVNTAAARRQADALAAALDAQKAATAAARARRVRQGRALDAAVAAAPQAASTVVPEAYWVAIYGEADSEAR